MEDKKLDTLLEMAIANEMGAYNMYIALSERVSEQDVKDTLNFLAKEELGHKKILEDYKDGKLTDSLELTEVVDYKIAEHVAKPEVKDNLGLADVYLIAAHAELASYNFYMELASMHEEGMAKQLLVKMANEEKKHKEKMEYYYTNSAFPQNAGG